VPVACGDLDSRDDADAIAQLRGAFTRPHGGTHLVVVGDGDHVERGVTLRVVEQRIGREQPVGGKRVEMQVGAAEPSGRGRRPHEAARF
jgi:hypothetical protein